MRVVTKGDSLVILLEGAERLWSLKASICVRATDIVKVQWSSKQPVIAISSFKLRLPGTSLPKVFYAGSFWKKAGWEFWYLKMRQEGELLVSTKLKRYHKIRLSVDEATAFEIREWFNKKRALRNLA